MRDLLRCEICRTSNSRPGGRRVPTTQKLFVLSLMTFSAIRRREIPSFDAFRSDIAKLAPGKAEERWDDCPAVSDDFDVAWKFITGRVETLVDRLSAKRSAK